MIQKERIKLLNQKGVSKGKYVLYWMQASQRTEYNHALEYGIFKANELRQPIIVFFGITDHFPEGNERHYYFMLEGLREVKQSLEERGIQMVIQHQSPELGAVQFGAKASLAVVDRGYLKIQKYWREYAAERMDCPLFQVESDVIVPVEEASSKEEYAAATFRPKMNKKLDHFLIPLRPTDPLVDSLSLDFHHFRIDDVGKAIAKLRIDRSIQKAKDYQGGPKEAQNASKSFWHRIWTASQSLEIIPPSIIFLI